jgi:multiple sugar transport system ATP-binding protein
VTLGTRPEHLAIGADGNGITGSILVVEPTGAETQVVVEAAQQQVVAVFSERHHFQPGAKITLTPRPEALHLFDSSSGRHLASH